MQTGSGLTISLFDSNVGASAAPNYERSSTPDIFNNSAFGTMTFRRKITNNTGVNVTRLRLRYALLTTQPAASGFSDLRPRTSVNASVPLSGGEVVTVYGTAREPLIQLTSSGVNSSLSVATVTAGAPLAPGESINISLLLGVQQVGRFLLTLNVEALPTGGASAYQIAGHTEGTCPATLTPPSALFGPAGGNSTIGVSVPIGCNWDVSQSPFFAIVTDGSTGTGSDTTSYSVPASSQRVRRRGNLVVANAIAGVTQLGTVADDFEFDGRADPAVYNPSTGMWSIAKSAGAYADAIQVTWGVPGDVPVAADFDGDGKVDPTVYREAGEGLSLWFVNRSSSDYTSSFAVRWGTTGDIPVPGYYDYDAVADPALFRPSTGQWFFAKSSSGFTSWFAVQWGTSTDIPVPADYDGDGRTDAAVYRP